MKTVWGWLNLADGVAHVSALTGCLTPLCALAKSVWLILDYVLRYILAKLNTGNAMVVGAPILIWETEYAHFPRFLRMLSPTTDLSAEEAAQRDEDLWAKFLPVARELHGLGQAPLSTLDGRLVNEILWLAPGRESLEKATSKIAERVSTADLSAEQKKELLETIAFFRARLEKGPREIGPFSKALTFAQTFGQYSFYLAIGALQVARTVAAVLPQSNPAARQIKTVSDTLSLATNVPLRRYIEEPAYDWDETFFVIFRRYEADLQKRGLQRTGPGAFQRILHRFEGDLQRRFPAALDGRDVGCPFHLIASASAL